MAKTIVTLFFVVSLCTIINAEYTTNTVGTAAGIADKVKDAQYIISELLGNVHSIDSLPAYYISQARNYQARLYSEIELSSATLQTKELIYQKKSMGLDVRACEIRLNSNLNDVYRAMGQMLQDLIIDYTAMFRESLRKHEKDLLIMKSELMNNPGMIDFEKYRKRLTACFQELEILNSEYLKKYQENSAIFKNILPQMIHDGIYNPILECLNGVNAGDNVEYLKQRVQNSAKQLNGMIFKTRINNNEEDQIFDIMYNWELTNNAVNALYHKQKVEMKNVAQCRLLMNNNLHALAGVMQERFGYSIRHSLDYNEMLYARKNNLVQLMIEITRRFDWNNYGYMMKNYLDQAEILKKDYNENYAFLYNIFNESIRNNVLYPTLNCLNRL